MENKSSRRLWPAVRYDAYLDADVIPQDSYKYKTESTDELIVLFGSAKYFWTESKTHLSFEENVHVIERQQMLLPSTRVEKAITEAKKYLKNQKQQDDERHEANLPSQMSMMRANTKSLPEDTACDACLQCKAGKECACICMKQLARAGHVGATLAFSKDQAKGVTVKVWWPNENCRFTGVISSYDPHTLTHRIDYDDGEVEKKVQLWKRDVITF